MMRSFREHCSPRDQHLTWGSGSVEHHLEERVHEFSHLAGVKRSDTKFDQIEGGDHLDQADLADHRKWHDSLTPEHHDTIMDYKHDSSTYNSHLRNAEKSADSLRLNSGYGDTKRYERMDKVTSNPLTRDHTLWRGVALNSGIHKLKPGSEFTDHGYTGTSVMRSVAHSFAGTHEIIPAHPDEARPGIWQRADPRVPKHFDRTNIVARIHAPAGTKAHYVDSHPDTPHPESEMTLHRGTRFRVTGHSLHPGLNGGNDVHVVHMEVVGQNPKKIRPPKWVENGGSY